MHANGVALMASYGVVAVSGLVFWAVAARIVTADELGTAATAIAASMLISAISTLGLHHTIVRRLPELQADEEQAAAVLGTALITTGLLGAALAGVFLAGVDVWAPDLAVVRDNAAFAVAFVLATITQSMLPILLHAFIARQRSVYSTVMAVAEAILKVALIGGLAAALATRGVYMAWAGAVLLSFAAGLTMLLPRSEAHAIVARFRFRPAELRSMFRFAGGSYLGDLTWFTPNSGLIGWILPLIVLNLRGTEASATFWVVWAAAAALNGIPVAMSMSLFAHGIREPRQLHEAAGRAISFSLLLLAPALFVVVSGADVLLTVFGSTYANEGANLLRVLALSAIPLTLNASALGVWRAEGHIVRVAFVGLVGGATTIGLTFAFEPVWGLLGVGAAWAIAQTALAVLITWPVWVAALRTIRISGGAQAGTVALVDAEPMAVLHD
jgi:O-antigen/teichoic acid export membrane protein